MKVSDSISSSVVSDSLRLHELHIAHQVYLSMEFSRQEHRSGLPFPSLGDLPNPGIKPRSPAFQADSSTSEPPGKSYCILYLCIVLYICIYSNINFLALNVCFFQQVEGSQRPEICILLFSVISVITIITTIAPDLYYRLTSVQFSHSVVSNSLCPWTAAYQVSLSNTNSQSYRLSKCFLMELSE